MRDDACGPDWGKAWAHAWGQQHHGAPWGGGPPPWVKAMLGGRGGFAPPGFTPGPKVRRGDVRAAILDVLAHEPMNGYRVIQQIAERSGGAWKPSPGSVYPTLQQLEDEGLVQVINQEGRNAYELTESGRTYVENHPEEMAATWRPFDDSESEDESAPDLKHTIGQVAAGVWQIAMSGNPRQQEEARKILVDTRRRLYGLLADGDDQ